MSSSTVSSNTSSSTVPSSANSGLIVYIFTQIIQWTASLIWWFGMNLIVSPITSTIGHMLYWLCWLIAIGLLAFFIEGPKPKDDGYGP